MPPNASTHFSRSSHACENCRRRKVKCSGKQPCPTCTRLGLDCNFGNITRRGYSELYVQKLLDKIKSQEEELRRRGATRQSVEPSADLASEHGNVTPGAASDSNRPDELPLSPVTELASGPTFESRVRSMLRDHVDNNSLNLQTSPESSAFVSSALEEEPHDHWRNALTLVDGIPSPALLPKNESRRLFERFSSLMGINQHFLDPRTFSDSMDLLYQSEASQVRQMQTMWYTEYLLVMAVGMLIGSTSEGSSNPPGNSFFAEAIHRSPPMHKLGSHGILAVEILCLASLYLQWCDRKYDAYLYIGSAVRLAIALGCSLPHDEQQGLSSEVTHKVRVWWTAYMLDRRLSAGLGLPTGTDERQMRSEFPRSSAGFQNPLPMIINIQIAQVTGKIMTSFYGNTAITRTELVNRIQDTLQNLHEIGRSIPSALSIDFSDSSSTIARTSASLYIMLFQAIILCIRPILLQRVKEKVQSSKENSPRAPVSPAISRLCQTCQEAAIKNIRILSALREDRSIALFGYFDLDATFSAAFVLTMMGFVEGDLQEPPEGLKQAAEVLKYLSKAGNSAAQRRLNELKQFCLHVWSPTNMTDDWSWLKEGSISSLHNSPENGQILGADEAGSSNTYLQGDGGNALASWGPAAWMSWQSVPANGEDPCHLDFSASENFQMDLSLEAGDIYSSFNDPTLPLTGVDDVDWAEERDAARKKIHGNRVKFLEWLKSLGAEPDLDGLMPFTRWVTPTTNPKRFTTQMYLYMLPLTRSNIPSEMLIPTPDNGIEHTAALFAPASSFLSRAASNSIILFPPQAYLLTLVAKIFTAPSGSLEEGPLQLAAQRKKLLSFLKRVPTAETDKGKQHKTATISWGDKVMSPHNLFIRKDDKRVVLGLDKPGPELKDTDRGGDWERVVLVNFGKGGPSHVEVRRREDVLEEEKNAKGSNEKL
ncbi:hypothetical protein NM208_g8478 [Fusarium decemcellulare]|uniref:Uncharacterized protein n=1 Tax=Fusarium decemcellulare TaxID=57161 RepID=A0ACC1S551_9HYPO|nr:hypothetical protein NM208_g8478 [Fusarium decemcellulare]